MVSYSSHLFFGLIAEHSKIQTFKKGGGGGGGEAGRVRPPPKIGGIVLVGTGITRYHHEHDKQFETGS